MQPIDALRTSYVEFVLPHFNDNDFSITLTYRENASQHSSKFVPQYDKPSRDIKHFLNIINRKVYGRQYKRRQRRLKCVDVFEHTSYNGLHVHMILENPADWNIPEAEKIALILKAWSSMQCCGYFKANCVEHVTELDRWVGYCFKNIAYFNDDRCDINNWQLNIKNVEIIQ